MIPCRTPKLLRCMYSRQCSNTLRDAEALPRPQSGDAPDNCHVSNIISHYLGECMLKRPSMACRKSVWGLISQHPRKHVHHL